MGLQKYAPATDSAEVVAAGAYAFREVVSSAQLPGVLHAYSEAFNKTMYVAVAASAATFVCAWGMGWHSLQRKKTKASETSS